MSIRSISSRENAQYKSLRQLASSAQARKKSAQTVLDGVHLCDAWLQQRGAPVTCVVSESASTQTEVAAIVDACLALDAPVLLMSEVLFAPLSQVENGIGLLFVIDMPETTTRVDLKNAAVLLDGVQDPGNLGSMLRTAAAAGISQIYCGSGTVSAWSPKVLRAGMGAHFVLDIAENIDLHTLISASRVPVLATSSHARISLYDMDLRTPCAWLFGNEGRGVSDRLLALCAHHLFIPQRSSIESLNVAASAAICLYEQVRQQGVAG